MHKNIQNRLQQLRTEYQSGQQMLQELREKQANTEQTMLRIAGAIQVLEELLAEEQAPKEDTPEDSKS